MTLPPAGDEPKYHSSGIWLRAAKINHACIPNCVRSFLGDLLIIRAARDIPADTELFMQYFAPTEDITRSRDRMSEWGFICKCALCKDVESTDISELTRRERLSAELDLMASAEVLDAVAYRAVLKVLEGSYKDSNSRVPKLRLAKYQFRLARLLRKSASHVVIMPLIVDAFRSLGYSTTGGISGTKTSRFTIKRWGIMTLEVVDALMYLGTIRPEAAKYLQIAYRIFAGEDWSLRVIDGRNVTGHSLGNP